MFLSFLFFSLIRPRSASSFSLINLHQINSMVLTIPYPELQRPWKLIYKCSNLSWRSDNIIEYFCDVSELQAWAQRNCQRVQISSYLDSSRIGSTWISKISGLIGTRQKKLQNWDPVQLEGRSKGTEFLLLVIRKSSELIEILSSQKILLESARRGIWTLDFLVRVSFTRKEAITLLLTLRFPVLYEWVSYSCK
jgi:hypothetical protein